MIIEILHTEGYDNNTKSGPDPTVVVSGAGLSLGKVAVSITWRKRNTGGINDCGTVGGTATPFYNEVSFKIQSPSGTIINLLNVYKMLSNQYNPTKCCQITKANQMHLNI